jgi:hypothetical protein
MAFCLKVWDFRSLRFSLFLHPNAFLVVVKILTYHLNFWGSQASFCFWCASWAYVGIVERLHCKRPIPICRLFFKIDLLTYIAALCLTDFREWRYIHSLVGIFDPACELLPPWTKELYLCTVAPLSSLWPPPPLPKLNVLFIQTVSVWGGGGGWGLNCAL